MASGSQNMTTYNARIVTGSNSAASPAGALLLSGAGRADDATGDTWIFLDSAGGTTNPWGIKHDQANNKLQIFGSGTNSVSVRMNTGNTYILGKVGIGYDPETSGNTYKLYVDGTSYFTNNLTMNGGTITLWGERYNGNYGLDCNNSDIININSLRTADNAETYGEGLMFKNGSAWDCMAASDGKFYFRGGTDGTPSLSQANSNASLYAAYFYGDLKGNADTCTYPLGFSSRSTGVTWGNTIGTTITSWNDSAGGSCDWRMNNPSSGKMSLKVDGRFYGNEGTYPAMLMRNENSYWGLCDPDAANNVWIRTTTQGIIPFQSGGRGSGHCGLGTSSWYFSYAYVDTYYANKYSTGHGYINGAATNGGINMILAGDDVWLGDCNAGGILGLKAANSSNCGLYFYNSSGTQIGKFYSDGTRIQCDKAMVSTGEFIGNTSQGFRLIHNNRGVFWHWNGSTPQFYLMFTDSGNPYGDWNSARPFYVNASTYYSYFVRAYNAVWNDFAEFRTGETEEGGWVVYDNESGIMKKTTKRLQAAARITSDTFGCAVGQSDTAKTPIGVGGRVLAHPYQDRNNYKIGDAVCSAPGGTVDIMTRDEIMMYPDRIIGIVSEIPDYPVWNSTLSIEGGGANTVSVEVKGRIWIYVR